MTIVEDRHQDGTIEMIDGIITTIEGEVHHEGDRLQDEAQVRTGGVKGAQVHIIEGGRNLDKDVKISNCST